MGGRGGWVGEEKQGEGTERSYLHLHIEPLKLTGTISGKGSFNYYTVNILNTFTGQTSATGDVCWIYYVNCSRSLETNCTFLLVCKRQSQWNAHHFCCSHWSTTDSDKVITELSHAFLLHVISICWVLLSYLNAWKGFVHSIFSPLSIFTFCLRLHFGPGNRTERLGQWFTAAKMYIY